MWDANKEIAALEKTAMIFCRALVNMSPFNLLMLFLVLLLGWFVLSSCKITCSKREPFPSGATAYDPSVRSGVGGFAGPLPLILV